MQYGFYFNGRRCAGCKTCIMACKDFHDLPPEISFRQVYEYGGGTWRREADGTLSQDAFAYSVSVACNHCGNPACVRVCPTGAMHKDERGLVSVDAARCIGCGYCALVVSLPSPEGRSRGWPLGEVRRLHRPGGRGFGARVRGGVPPAGAELRACRRAARALRRRGRPAASARCGGYRPEPGADGAGLLRGRPGAHPRRGLCSEHSRNRVSEATLSEERQQGDGAASRRGTGAGNREDGYDRASSANQSGRNGTWAVRGRCPTRLREATGRWPRWPSLGRAWPRSF